MSVVNVRTLTNNVVRVGTDNRTSSAITVKKGADLTLQSLNNVVSTDLQDGYTLVYDSDLNKWVAQRFDGSIASIDGGTY